MLEYSTKMNYISISIKIELESNNNEKISIKVKWNKIAIISSTRYPGLRKSCNMCLHFSNDHR